MKKLRIALLAVLSVNTTAKTTLYGEANANVQSVFTNDGSTLVVDGALSQFGFQNRVNLESSLSAFSDVALGVNLTDPVNPWVNKGVLGLDGYFGRVSFFYGDTPIGHSNRWLKLMDREPDFLSPLLGGQAASSNELPTGVASKSGLAYRPPAVAETLTFEFAVLPAERINGDSGFSMTAEVALSQARMLAGFEVNSESESDQLLRLMIDANVRTVTLGGGAQFTGNRDVNSSATSLFGYGKWPISLFGTSTKMRLLTGITQMTDPNDKKSTDLYASWFDEQIWVDKLSSYSFVQWNTLNDRDDVNLVIGQGLRLIF